MKPIKEFKADNLSVRVFASRDGLGKSAALDIAKRIRELLIKKDEINIIFAAAPSQNETLKLISEAEGIDWTRVNAFHMDEYIGLAAAAPQGFGNFLKERLFNLLPLKSVSYINGQCASPAEECRRYAALLKVHKPDIVCMGIGENGHIAFNDPEVARFDDSEAVKIVVLDDICRQQQVNDGCFAKLGDVPKEAITLTIPTLMSAENIFCMVPAATKANAVRAAIKDAVSEECPASILRRHESAVLYIDTDSGSGL